MQRLRWCLAMLLIVPALMSFSARAALHLPSLTAGANTYSNVAVTSSAGGRVTVEYPGGMASVKIADLDLDTQQQLAEAGLVAPELAKQIEKQVAKRDAERKKSNRRSSADSSPTDAVPTMEEMEKTSIASLFTSRMGQRAQDNNVEFDLNWIVRRFGAALVGGISFVLILAGIVRRVLFYRICKNATGYGSLLVFIPVLRWLALAEAARIGKQWLLLPLFAMVALFLPPPFVQQVSWATMAYMILLAVLWFATLMLYVIWCVRLCLTLGRSAGWAFFLIFPLLDYVALFVLASSEGKGDNSSALGAADPTKSPILAI